MECRVSLPVLRQKGFLEKWHIRPLTQETFGVYLPLYLGKHPSKNTYRFIFKLRFYAFTLKETSDCYTSIHFIKPPLCCQANKGFANLPHSVQLKIAYALFRAVHPHIWLSIAAVDVARSAQNLLSNSSEKAYILEDSIIKTTLDTFRKPC